MESLLILEIFEEGMFRENQPGKKNKQWTTQHTTRKKNKVRMRAEESRRIWSATFGSARARGAGDVLWLFPLHGCHGSCGAGFTCLCLARFCSDPPEIRSMRRVAKLWLELEQCGW